MALVREATWSIAYQFRDNNGNTSSASVNVDSTVILADIQTLAATLAARLSAVSDAELVGYSLSLQYTEDSPVAALETSEVERKLRVPLTAGVYRNASYLEVPSPRFTLEVNGTDIVDLADPAIVALREALVNAGGVLGSSGLRTYFGADITATGEPFVTHRNRKKSA